MRHAREDFEEIVKEIDGGLDCLKWEKKVLYFPHFTNQQDAISPYINRASNNSRPDPRDLNKSSFPADCGLTREEEEEEDDGGGVSGRSLDGLPEKLEAERDVSEINAFTSESQDCFYKVQIVHTDGLTEVDVPVQTTVKNSACDSTTVWSSVDTDVDSCCSVKELRRYCLARDVPRTPESLRDHRNTLSMELLWLQQAIDSRKKYLSLKNKLSGS